MHTWIRKMSLILSVYVVMITIESPSITSYVASIKNGETTAVFSPMDDLKAIQHQVEKGALVREIKPIDAHLDAIWKAIPGYNGQKVDIRATVKKTWALKSKKIIWVYKEIEPTISLDELGVHPIYRGNENKKQAALMMNVAWGTEHLPRILEILSKEKVQATFFLDGSWLTKNEGQARRILQAGHEIGNHGYSHPLMTQISHERIVDQIKRTEDVIHRSLSVHSKWFAPPAGDYNQDVVDTAYQYGMRTVLWTVDTIDWRKSSTPALIVQRVEERLTPGSLILTHPTERTVAALPEMIQTIRNKGLKLGTVSEVLSSKREGASN